MSEGAGSLYKGESFSRQLGPFPPISASRQAKDRNAASQSSNVGGFGACQTSSTHLSLGDLSIDWNISVPKSRRLVGLFSEVWSVQMSEMKVGTFNE